MMALPRPALPTLLVTLTLATGAFAQVPDGYVVFGTFSTSSPDGRGIFFAHPRDSSAPFLEVTNLPQNLSNAGSGSRGVASLLRRPGDGALLVGERAPSGASLDFHVLQLAGQQVVFAQLFSCGTSAGVGEIPQFGLLPDGRVVLSATDLQPGGVMSHFTNGAYGWQGLAILDTESGAFAAIPVSNWSAFTGVINGMAVSRDGQTVWLGAYISVSSGALWQVPVAGGAMTQVAALPFGDSNVAVDHDDSVLLTTLNGPPNLFRYDPTTTQLAVIPSNSGPLNAIAVEPATGNYLIATANAGTPARSLVWRTPTGSETVLQATPTNATISAVSSNPNPENYGAGTPGTTSYHWLTAPNPGGLPELGNQQFSLTVASEQSIVAPGVIMVGFAPSAPVTVVGVDVYVAQGAAVYFTTVLADTATLDVPLPTDPSFVGLELFAQSFWAEPAGGLAASDAVSMTIL
ncbi:MAG: hypothetical protein KDE27_28255 [Planctomycetes bacterium]|nr:hypothetical protein [Planctomycetota bacterium]